MLRFTFAAVLLTASFLISGAQKINSGVSPAEKEQIQAAQSIVSGTVEDAQQWQSYAQSNPELFIKIEAGIL